LSEDDGGGLLAERGSAYDETSQQLALAATLNDAPRRISVVGATGSGKTVLAGRLSQCWGLPLYGLDRVFWDAQGRGAQSADFIEAVSALTQQDAWVLDGHYRAVRELIWRRSEMIVWLNYPMWLVASRLVRRFVQKRHAIEDRQRAGQGSGSEPREQSATWSVRVARLARTLRERKEYGRLLEAPGYRDKVIELRSPRATEDLIMSRRSTLAQ